MVAVNRGRSTDLGQGHLKLTVHSRPGSRRTVVARLPDDAGDQGGADARNLSPTIPAVVVRVHAKAVDGAANLAIVDAIATALGVRRSAVTIRRGHTARVKHIEVAGDRADLLAAVNALPLTG